MTLLSARDILDISKQRENSIMTMNTLKPAGRDISLDILKGILTFFVMTTHMVSFFPFRPVTYITGRLINIYVVYTCLMTFSAFMLILGYMCYKAYISRELPKAVLGRKLMKNFVKTMLTYFASALAYVFFIKQELTLPVLRDIFLFRYVVEYSEFILSFAAVYIIVFIFEGQLRKLTKPVWMVLVLLSLASTFIPYERVKEPLLAVFTGSTLFSSFSVFQYFCYFITGVYAAKVGVRHNKCFMLLCAGATAAFVAWRLVVNDYPSRFPPSLLWIAGGAFFDYCAFVFCRRIPVNAVTKLLAVMGRDSLYYMLFSNIVLFALRRITMDIAFDPGGIALIVFYIFAFSLSAAVAWGYTRLRGALTKK